LLGLDLDALIPNKGPPQRDQHQQLDHKHHADVTQQRTAARGWVMG
jgi:hypothetical protein